VVACDDSAIVRNRPARAIAIGSSN